VSVHVVVPEGLANSTDGAALSAPFQAVVALVARIAADGDTVYMSPGNRFGGPVPEEVLAADILRDMRPGLWVVTPTPAPGTRYLDTLDNARELRRWLEAKGRWPLPPVRLYCNAPHALRSGLMFRLEGYTVESVETVRRVSASPRPVGRLWYMGVPLVHQAYEACATLYDTWRWILGRGARP
jgi:hypothetical protein